MLDDRRAEDRLLGWSIKAFMVLSICSTLASVYSSTANTRLSKEMAVIRAEIVAIKESQLSEATDRAQRLKTFDAFRSQMAADIQMRDGDIYIIKRKLGLPAATWVAKKK